MSGGYRCFVGDHAVEAWPAGDRGTAYGDALFETMRGHRGGFAWWDAHWRRLARGASRLGLALPAEAAVHAQATGVLGRGDGVVKLLVSRGAGGRGYAPPGEARPAWQLSHHPVPAPMPAEGLALRWCDTRLAIQPLLAGLKHCNRLEQVLARREWAVQGVDAASIHEGLMRSSEGDVVCATAANLFVRLEGRWWTPPVDRCGVAGVCREWVLGVLDVGERRLSRDDVETAESVFLGNAVRGILPVARLGSRCWARHPEVTALQARLSAEVPAFAMEMS